MIDSRALVANELVVIVLSQHFSVKNLAGIYEPQITHLEQRDP